MAEQKRLSRSLAARMLVALTACAALAGMSGCQSVSGARADAATPPRSSASASSAASAAASPTRPPVPPQVVPAGLVAGQSPWDRPLTVHVHHGRLLALTAVDTVTGALVPGTAAATSWRAATTQVPGRAYRITATIRGTDGSTVGRTLTVTTTPPSQTFDSSVTPYGGVTVGVGAPLIVTFSRPVTDRAAVTAALKVSTSTPVTGAWRWFSSREVHWRPKTYWPAHTQVVLHDDLLGVQASPGVWGLRDRDVTFRIGDAHVSTVDVATQTMTVTDNGVVVGRYPVSTGRAQYPTKGGVHIVLSKQPSIVMDSATVGIPKGNPDYYHETVLWDVRISDGGAFVHYAPWSVASQGRRPVSHGCVNVALAPAIAFYNLSLSGDVVDIVNDPVGPNLSDAGMADWNYTWSQWSAGT